jgi:enamine deaminase RidA (YjgF/YER057c/UK114 family)
MGRDGQFPRKLCGASAPDVFQHPELGRAYRETFGSHYPAMAVVQVAGLVEKAAKIEIEATAVVAE